MEENKDLSKTNKYIDSFGCLLLNEETYTLLQNFGSLYWSSEDIATFFGIYNHIWWEKQINNPLSEISKAIHKGRLEKRAAIELNILQLSLQGDSEAIAQYNELVRDKSFSLSKLDLFGGTTDLNAWQKIQDYIINGSKGQLSTKEQKYIDILMLIHSIDSQYGKRKTIKFLTSPPFGFTYEQATNLYSESTEMFFCNKKISREALKNKTADMLENLYLAAVNSAKTAKDFEAASNILIKRAKLLKLDEQEIKKLEPEVYRKQFRHFDLDPSTIGLPNIDRRLLAQQIEALPIPDNEKVRIRQDAAIDDLDITERMYNESQEES